MYLLYTIHTHIFTCIQMNIVPQTRTHVGGTLTRLYALWISLIYIYIYMFRWIHDSLRYFFSFFYFAVAAISLCIVFFFFWFVFLSFLFGFDYIVICVLHFFLYFFFRSCYFIVSLAFLLLLLFISICFVSIVCWLQFHTALSHRNTGKIFESEKKKQKKTHTVPPHYISFYKWRRSYEQLDIDTWTNHLSNE